jgi:hypothetical protein
LAWKYGAAHIGVGIASAVGAAILFFVGNVEQAAAISTGSTTMTPTAWEIIVAGGWTIYLLLAVNRREPKLRPVEPVQPKTYSGAMSHAGIKAALEKE